jgi:hypothetical protein
MFGRELVLQHMRDCTDTIKLVTGCLHLLEVSESQPEVVRAQLDLADEAFKLPRYEIVPDSQILQVILDFALIRL